MRQLRFVGVADDGSHAVVETTDGSERFALLPDPRLDAGLLAGPDAGLRAMGAPPVAASPPIAAKPPVAASPPVAAKPPIAAAAPPAAAEPPPPAAPARELRIGPREIQVRVRAGESPQQVADSCGVAVEQVMRFATPVLEERLRIADEARRARAHRSKGDGGEGALVVFGEAVDDRFVAHGIDAADVTWSAWRRDDGEWVLRAEWLGGEGTHGAEWVFHRSSRSVTALDATASDLLSDRPIRPLVTPVAAAERPSLAAAPRLAPGVVAFPAMPEAHTDPLPVVEEVFDQHAAEDSHRRPPFLPPESEQELGFDAPPLPLGITDPSTRPLAVSRLSAVRNVGGGKRAESEEERAARVKVPSWDDILLGVRRKQD